jgi:multidrug efflux system membrane fusion protein
MRVKILLLIVAVLLGGGAAYVWKAGSTWEEWGNFAQAAIASRFSEARTGQGAEAADIRNSTDASVRVPRVVVTPVRKGDVPIYVSGLGTVQAYATVNVKAQVDGVIQRMPFTEGQNVKIGDILVAIDPQMYQAKLDQAKAEKEKANVQLANAKANLWRDQELLKNDYATQKQTDQDKMLVGQYTADLAQAEADIAYAQTQLDYTVIRSPVNGMIGIRNVDSGNLIRAADNTTLVTVVQLEPISVIVSVPAKELRQHNIALGRADLPIFAYAENGITPLGRGTVDTVNNTVDQTTGTIKLKASFGNAEHKLWPGDFVDCRIMVDKHPNGLTVPTAAIHHGPRADFVWVITPEHTAALRPVRVRQSLGGTSLIEGNLQAGDNVVLDGYQRLQVGSRVEIASDAANAEPRVSSTE